MSEPIQRANGEWAHLLELANAELVCAQAEIAELRRQVDWLNKDACVPCDSKAKLAVATEALESISRQRYGLQGLIEDGESDAVIRAHLVNETDRDRRTALSALAKIKALAEEKR